MAALVGLLAIVLGACSSTAPLAVSSPPTVRSVSAVDTWGFHIGDTARPVTGLPNSMVALQAANWGGLGIDSTGHVWQWFGSSSPRALAVKGPTKVLSVGEGGPKTEYYGAAATSSGQLWTWGDENGAGDLCLGSTGRKNVAPTQVPGIDNARAVSGGAEHLLILLDTGQVEACGGNMDGQLGDGTTTHSASPVAVTGLSGIVAISAGSSFSLALDSSGHVWAWGEGNFGQLGDGNTNNSDVPVEVPLPGSVREVFAGGSASTNGQAIALLDDGSVYAWGNNQWAQLGTGAGPNSDTPVKVTVPAGITYTYVATGGSSSYGLDTSGNLWAWGNDSKGELGDGRSTGTVATPERVDSGLTLVSAVAAVAVVG
jgi:alpha-tubulin suppressor-like RCC1 family protein